MFTKIASTFLLIVGLVISTFATSDKLELYFFGSSTCGECLKIKEELLKPLMQKYPDKLLVHIHDIENKESFQLMMKLEQERKLTTSSSQELFFPDTFLLGYESIMANGKAMIESYLADPKKWSVSKVEIDTAKFENTLREKASKFSFWGILAAGLLDGVNPCAIATMIFLISFLATQKKKRSEILIIGLSYTGAVFITYLLLGIGAFKMLTVLGQYYWLSRAVRWTAVGLALFFGIVSFWDAFRYKKTHNTKDIKNQLPKAVKLRIHRIISGNLSGSQLVMGSIVTGFLVTLLEAVCTGQVYIPTIVLMTKQEGLRLTGWLYLIFYNILFVLPLLTIMVLAYFGLKWDKVAKVTQKNLVLLKVLFGIVLIFLAGFLAIAS